VSAPLADGFGADAPSHDAVEQQLKREQRRLHAVRELGRVLGATLDLDRLLVVLLEKVTEILDAERATIFLTSDDGTLLESKIAQGGAIAAIRLRVGEGIAGWVAQSGATLNIPDAYADPRFNKDIDKASGFRTRSLLCLPMPDHRGRTIGVLQMLNKRLRPFDADDEELAATVAAHAGISLENSKLYQSVLQKNTALLLAQEQLRQRIAELDILFEIEREASAAINLDELLDRLLQRAVELVDAEAGSVLLRERASGDLFFRSARGRGAESLRRIKLPPGQGIVGWVALHAQPLLVNDPAHDARHDTLVAESIGVPARNILAAPLLRPRAGEDEHDPSDDANALGAIELVNKRGGAPFDAADLKLLTLIAGQAARAILIARNREERATQGRLASLGQMMSGVMHDLKTPMTIISGYAQLMAATDESQPRNDYAELINKQFDLMAAMTREVLLFARGETQLLIRKVYLHKWVPEVAAQLERELAGKPIELRIDLAYSGVGYFDELKMYRVIHNLARNAAQAMDSGGTFTIGVDVDGTELVLSFADNGPGIPEAMQGRLFEAFATSGKPDGTGLGLAIVKKIVDEHEGRISYESAAGSGTTFRIALPLARSA
jgi:signal transduction histidine kinase/putative methionine-R-sulfoxide reductase with GAF domain